MWQAEHHFRFPRIDRVAVDESVEFLEAARDGAGLVHVPFATRIRAVSGGAQDFGQRHAAVGQAAEVAGKVVALADETSNAGLMRIQPGEQTRAGGTTAAGVVALREPHPFGCQRVDVGRANFAAVAAQIGEPQIVSQYDDDVGLRRFASDIGQA